MAEAVIGRHRELERATGVLGDDSPLLRALVLDGEAGIGKTTVWRSAVADARRLGFIVLACHPAESESGLPFAALTDLLEPIGDDVLAALPGAQRGALDAALQRADDGAPAGQLAVSRAVLSLVRGLAGSSRIAVAVDDVQWLDPPTEHVLEFVLRRLVDVPVRVLVARRSERELSPPLGLARVDGRVEAVRVGPLAPDALDELLRARHVRLARPRLLELHRISGGNPFYALEIARLLDGSGTHDGALRVPDTLADVLAARLRALDEHTRAATLVAAAALQPTAELVERATGRTDGLAGAIASDVLQVQGRRLRFTHPLLASVAYEAAAPWERREAHARLAAAAVDRVERANHLAAATELPHEATAAELEAAAGVAAARGGPELAARLADAAAALTPADDDDERRRRSIVAAEHHVAAGDPARGRAIFERLLADTPKGPARAGLLYRLADAIDESLEESIRLCEQALDEAAGDPGLTAEIHNALSIFTWLVGDLERSAGHCRECARLAAEGSDEVQLAIATAELTHAQAVLGLPWSREAMAEALEIERRHDAFPTSQSPSLALAIVSTYTDDLDTARPLLRAELERVTARGDEPARATVLFRVSELELRAGNWADALGAAREASRITRQGGIDQERNVTTMQLATVLAHLGELDEARELGERALAAVAETGDLLVTVRCKGALGLVELSAGEPALALELLTPARAEIDRMRARELSIYHVAQNELEALVSVGRLDEASAVVELIELAGRPTGRSWHRAIAARGRALLASAGGDAVAARAALEQAFAAHESLPQPFERARTRLVAGIVERRDRRWRAAREQLTAALDQFDHLGARAWAERAAGELARVGGRPPASAGDLTETERRIADLAARGWSNKEIAAAIFVSVRAVEANLTRVYAKLGIHSRTELAARRP